MRRGSVCVHHAAISLLTLLLAGCVPRIEVAAPTTPITINMNVRVEHDITIRADKDATRLLESGNNAAVDAVNESESRVETTTREQARAETVVSPAAAAAQGR
ncbi:YnbE family lipoprotein [Candidatus Symbiopectobacterium sp. NZEC127]|uniref:YnbE family lipoprotein n=1 Tax=Candidatus Symbiopectobacterium sp. NZEC127 TaxID=2820472 RepID=UPI00222770B7|nr:YnbE family lipoprotein [Candidatus Symbiopectobacterium sp. NZEC127]MCW2485325.1 YnbE family lipoprotein [Candidatus Symbiopectobacterium sp. NZEC127]